ncbi:unnamed protein product [Caretta caretta]
MDLARWGDDMIAGSDAIGSNDNAVADRSCEMNWIKVEFSSQTSAGPVLHKPWLLVACVQRFHDPAPTTWGPVPADSQPCSWLAPALPHSSCCTEDIPLGDSTTQPQQRT